MTTETALRQPDHLQEMADLIKNGGPVLHGGGNVRRIAQEWLDEGLTPALASSYIDVECWDACSVGILVRAGIAPSDLCDSRVVALVDERGMSPGYAHSNNDLSTGEILRALEREAVAS